MSTVSDVNKGLVQEIIKYATIIGSYDSDTAAVSIPAAVLRQGRYARLHQRIIQGGSLNLTFQQVRLWIVDLVETCWTISPILYEISFCSMEMHSATVWRIFGKKL